MKSKFLNVNNINLYNLLKDIIRNLWLIIIIGCLGVMATYTYIKDTFVPEYTSSAIYVVTPKASNSYGTTTTSLAENVVTVFQNLINTDIMKNRIAEELHMESIDATITVEQITQTNLIKLTATTNDPMVPIQVIDAVMNNYAELSEYLTSDAVFNTIKSAEIPTSSDNSLTPRKKSIQIGLLCALAALIIVVLASLMRKTVRKEEVIEEDFNTTLLGTIYHEKKNRTVRARIVQSVKTILITSPIVSGAFIESINNIRIRMEYEHERHSDRNVFMISSVCENEGKSTVALNIALSLAKESKRVIVIDADMRKPAMYKMLNIPAENVTDLIKVLQGDCGLDKVLYEEKDLGLELIMSAKGHASTYEFMKSPAMKDLIHKCSKMADYVVIDTPPMAMLSDAEELLDVVDFSALVVRQDVSYEKDIRNCINIMNDADSQFMGCVLNDYRELGKKAPSRTYDYQRTDGKAVEVYGE